MAEKYDDRTAQRMLRHADRRSTQKYLHEALGQLRQKMEEIDEMLPVPEDEVQLRTVETGSESEQSQADEWCRRSESNRHGVAPGGF